MKILAYDYRIIALRSPVESSTVFGKHDAINLTITICTEMDKRHQESTMIHEVIEAINWQLRLGLDEKKIIGLEVGLYDVFRNAGMDVAPLMRELYGA